MRRWAIGAAVLVALAPGERLAEEGVVIEVVAPRATWTSQRVAGRRHRLRVETYVVQTWTCRVARPATAMIVVAA
jgi:hypothetical protein